MVMEEKLLTAEQAATYLQVHLDTVRRWLREGKLRGTRLGGTKAGWRIAEREVLRLLEEAQRG